MIRIPGVTENKDRPFKASKVSDYEHTYTIREAKLTCLDLDKVPEDVRGETIKALALGSEVAESQWKVAVTREGKSGSHPHRFTDALSVGVAAGVGGGVLGFFFLCIGIWLYPGQMQGTAWIVQAMAALGFIAPVLWWVVAGYRVVSLRDAIDAEVSISDLTDEGRGVAAQAQNEIEALIRDVPDKVTDEVWLAAYQVQADLAVAHLLSKLEDPDAKAREKLLTERALQGKKGLTRLRVALITDPAAEAKKQAKAEAAEREAEEKAAEQKALRDKLADYIAPEPQGNYIEITAGESAEPEGNHADPGFGQIAYAPYPKQEA